MLDLIRDDYAAERVTALLGLAVGLGWLVISAALWIHSGGPSLGRGTAYGLIVFGLFAAMRVVQVDAGPEESAWTSPRGST
ncbi:hypothetical protein [Chondromyces apiculatus]|uniref:hypothetical protein n=1 Tax=Chondromyces apiculatus TaxID=51 RepID=UPI0012DFD7FC|nr:hypothetical protein [Chondromyces apiculatus]